MIKHPFTRDTKYHMSFKTNANMDVFNIFYWMDRFTENAFVVHNLAICFSQVSKDSSSLRRCTSRLFSTDAISITNPP